jgi:HSP20 family molecular chaperone IbpA
MAAKVAADFNDGVLTVHLPKTAESKPKAIEVKVA